MSSEIKILTGYLKGKSIKILKGSKFRPTMEQARLSLFNSLGERIQNSYFLDLFAGSGIIGIEAISLGAEKVFFVENHIPAVRLLKFNVKNLGIEDKVEIFGCDIFFFLKRFGKYKFDIIFMDPPYSFERIDEVLNLIERNLFLREKGILVVEHHKKTKLPEELDSLKLIQVKNFGETFLSYYSTKENENV